MQQTGGTALKPGDKALLKVSGTASGKHAVELELELEYKVVSPSEALIAVLAYATLPDTAPKGNNSKRDVIALPQLERQRDSLARASKSKETQARSFAKQIADLQQQETLLTNPNRPQNPQQLANVRVELLRVQQEHADAEEMQNKFSAGHSWYADMATLVGDLQARSKLGFRVFRPLGGDVVEIARPPAGP